MPLTPFHLGPSFFIGILLRRYLNFFIFILASVIIDIEPFCVLLFSLNYPLHGFLHTFLGGLFAAFIFSTVVYNLGFIKLLRSISFKKILLSAIVGIYLHILLDSLFHADVTPFYPLKINPFYGIFSAASINLFCIVLAISGLILYEVKLIRNKSRLFSKLVIFVILFVCLALLFGIYSLSWHQSSYDDGPFLGIEYTGIIQQSPSSKINLNYSYIFEVYNDLDARAPVVILRDRDQRIIWSKLLMLPSDTKASGNHRINKIEFSRARKIHSGYQIQGKVSWTFGNEIINFYLDKKGNLKGFYLSW